ncbi:MAG: hypothetical protein WDW38_005650 [Sanguina aurantia]
MNQMWDFVVGLSGIPLSQPGVPGIPLPDLGKIALGMRALAQNLDIKSRQRGDAPEATFPGMRAEQALFLTDLARLISALVPQLHRFSTRLSSPTLASMGTEEEVIFWELWGFLRAGSSAYSQICMKLPNLWPHYERPFNGALIAAFHSVLTWLLPLTRSPAWRAMTLQDGLVSRNHELLGILLQPTVCGVVNVHQARPHSSMLTQLHALPSTFLPLLCCIATEHLGSAPPLASASPAATRGTTVRAMNYAQARPYGVSSAGASNQLLTLLVTSINNFLALAGQGNAGSGQFGFLGSPAVLQFLKVFLTLGDDLPPASPNPVHCAITCMHAVLSIDNPQARSCLSQSGSPLDGVGNRDADGLPLQADPFTSPYALETDVRLLHALSKPMEDGAHGQLLMNRHACQMMLLQRWGEAGKAHPLGSDAVLGRMDRSIQGLAKQCAWLGLGLLKQQQQQRQRAAKPIRQASQQQQHAVAKLTFARLAALGREGSHTLRVMFFMTANFFYQEGIPRGNLGK